MSGVHDYVIVGAGTAGCVLAARLAASGASVLLLEAGGLAPAGELAEATSWPDLLGSQADWGDVTIPQADAGPRPYPTGRGLGGSGSLNAMAHVRGHRAVYDAWAAAGATGWDYESLLPYFMRSERRPSGDPRHRGDSGPVAVAPVPEQVRHPVAVALAEALTAAGHPLTGDLSAGRQEGVAWADLAIDRSGARVSPYTAYLRPAMDCHPGLEVRTGCLATRVEIRAGRCTGVAYVRDGSPGVAWAGEVIVCAGAVGSPRLLMLSGIGPADWLRQLGISPAADLPGTGRNLQDHPAVLAVFRTARRLPRSRFNLGEVYAALRSPLSDGIPDLHVFPVLPPAGPAGAYPFLAGFCVGAAVMVPASRGTVRLASADPQARPLIDPAFLAGPGDLDRLEAGLAIARHAADGPAFAALGVTELAPGPGTQTAAGVRAWLRRMVGSYNHPVGTCRMGTNADTVTDPQLRVRGIAGLRVADASVMPVIPNAHPHATVLAIAEKVANLITGQP